MVAKRLDGIKNVGAYQATNTEDQERRHNIPFTFRLHYPLTQIAGMSKACLSKATTAPFRDHTPDAGSTGARWPSSVPRRKTRRSHAVWQPVSLNPLFHGQFMEPRDLPKPGIARQSHDAMHTAALKVVDDALATTARVTPKHNSHLGPLLTQALD